MELTWLGHSSFLIKDSKNRLILTDPFNNQVGYDTYKGNADFVTISHSHFDHSYIDEIKGNPSIIKESGTYNFDNLNIIGFNSYHDKQQGAVRGKNTIFTFEVDSYRLCHLGDIGYILNDDEITALGPIDILLIPVGGNFTIDGKEAEKLCHKINSSIIIPMHYKTSILTLPLDGVENFIRAMKSGERINSSTIHFHKKLQGLNEVKILTI
ncbi:putative Zn-dependent hydrolase of the beta-lactamase fold [Clostridium pasteurianum DSM 525 = ATCC 6013]|uniref:Putative Zn-dependent hydrolase of the beta-lactamase fold n=1 Tax=Clostridium pasteurianum DSM 525 = ATCC 6013 TaxID=1262449 RepID=A0A0H3IXT5_CLOPA|nr:MBL fold metallo-hydrolase [Clostridium pasteurianum]AJA46291.1 putative Zn-dependent hydrolase of the beta-lactamase fold [Clostridium pasteurianum DSM 525 = ATCC 6013]AJA50279.1 putative Zn-dependent hydrolase of the beta-lactamase fold [Clostridium pasteurianum DSM 525 = ATCC 6013]AOZ73742.1 MBL fold metallo-hydrolase [Clostridium pasteurianum DSM 525 = ATCC 6013]AOZ77539.1 MBL fold metallo-hydrolase [Clostridium pasteurianum]ELP60875.1 Zn-dependent hydrolase of the metallo-beta-lactamas